MKNCELTIVTPVFNRADLITNCYSSLKRQKCTDFIWMIIDDGSTDGIESVVEAWSRENNAFSIEFYRKENGGKSTAYNLALEKIQTPYWTCIDSDDWVNDNTVERYVHWINYTRNMNIAGFVGLDQTPDGDILGGYFPYEGIAHLIDIKTKIRHRGDMNMVYRTDISKRCAPMPTISGEVDFEPYYFLLKIDEIAPLYMVNDVFCVANYQADGLTHNVWRTYYRSPISMGMLRLEYLKREKLPLTFAYRQCIHYVSSWNLCQKCPEKKGKLPIPIFRPLMILAWIPGWILSRLTIYKYCKFYKKVTN